MIVHYLVSPVLLTFILWEGISIDLIINKFLALIALYVFCMNMETSQIIGNIWDLWMKMNTRSVWELMLLGTAMRSAQQTST